MLTLHCLRCRTTEANMDGCAVLATLLWWPGSADKGFITNTQLVGGLVPIVRKCFKQSVVSMLGSLIANCYSLTPPEQQKPNDPARFRNTINHVMTSQHDDQSTRLLVIAHVYRVKQLAANPLHKTPCCLPGMCAESRAARLDQVRPRAAPLPVLKARAPSGGLRMPAVNCGCSGASPSATVCLATSAKGVSFGPVWRRSETSALQLTGNSRTTASKKRCEHGKRCRHGHSNVAAQYAATHRAAAVVSCAV